MMFLFVQDLMPHLSRTICEHTQKDDSFHLILEHIHQGFPVSIKEMPDCIKPYFTFGDELAVVNGLMLKGERVLIPKSLCEVSEVSTQISHGHN